MKSPQAICSTLPCLWFQGKLGKIECAFSLFHRHIHDDNYFGSLLCRYGIYSLLYQRHKSWYSWILNTLVGFIYMFGFVMMTPQVCMIFCGSV
jgi:hypothetical protein